MDFKQRCIRGIFIGIALGIVGVLCMIFGSRSQFFVVLAFALVIAGGVLGRYSFRRYLAANNFEREKEKDLERLEALFSAGSISQEEYYALKIEILNAEYDD